MNFSTIFCSMFIPIYLPTSLSPHLLQHLPWQCPVSQEGPQLRCSPLQSRIKPLSIILAQSLGTRTLWRSSRHWCHDRASSLHSSNCPVKYSDGTRLVTSATSGYSVTRHSLHLPMLTCSALCLPQSPPSFEHQSRCMFSLSQITSERGAGSGAAVSPLFSAAAGISSANLLVPLQEGVWYGSSETA